MLNSACVQRCMYKRNTVYSISCQQCPKKYVGQTTATIKKRCSERRNWCQKKHKKKIFKLQRRKLELLFIIMKRDTLLILRIRKLKLLQKKSILEKADNINRGIEIKKLSQAERAHLQMGKEIDPIWDTFIESIKTWPPRGLKLPLGFEEKWKYSWEMKCWFSVVLS